MPHAGKRKASRSARVLRACIVAIGVPMLVGATDITSNFEDRILAAHNRERAGLGLEPLRWDARLAASARGWADDLAARNAFEHAPERSSDPQGENLWAGTRGYYTLERMVDGWIREKRYFRPGRFPDNSTTGRVEDVGHYTQVVWRDTLRVGCAKSASGSEDILVCRYSSAGNYIGEIPF